MRKKVKKTLKKIASVLWVKDMTGSKKSTRGAYREKKVVHPRRPPLFHQGTLDEAIARLGLRGVTTRRMFGGLCYYAEMKPFAILLAQDLALKLPIRALHEGYKRGAGRVFNPGGGDFRMREYLALSEQTLMDEARFDTYVFASHQFVTGQETDEKGLSYEDLLKGREALYQHRQPTEN